MGGAAQGTFQDTHPHKKSSLRALFFSRATISSCVPATRTGRGIGLCAARGVMGDPRGARLGHAADGLRGVLHVRGFLHLR